jgi:ceramide glucosyltransferase
MEWYFYIAIWFMAMQVLYCLVCYRNYRFVLSKGTKERGTEGKTILVVPCKGLDEGFEENICSLFRQDYDDYSIWFVVQEETDPAYRQLLALKKKMEHASKAREIRVLVAGLTAGCSQKVHNQLHACRRMTDDVVIMAFADSDLCAKPDWLGHLVHPLRKKGHFVASSGYRWFVPTKVNLATLALVSMNSKVVQGMGPYGFNHTWGGSMAIRREVFKELRIDEVWAKSITDDLSLSRVVKEAGYEVAFVPGCIVPSYVSMGWAELLEFSRRQFVITKVTTPKLWVVGLISVTFSVVGLWGGAALAIYAKMTGYAYWGIYAAVPVVFLLGHPVKAWLRQKTAAIVIDDQSEGLKAASRADMLLSWLWPPLLLGIILASAVCNTITWRGIRYKVRGPMDVVVLGKKS